MEPVEGDVRDVLDVRGQAYLHPAFAGAALHPAPEQRLPQQLEQQRQERPPLLFHRSPGLSLRGSCRAVRAAAAAVASSLEHVAIG
jgi:hypothetical protein